MNIELADLFSPVLYRIHDAKKLPGCFEISGDCLQTTSDDPLVARLIEAHKYNAEGWGIFWAVNEFEGPRRIENLKKIRAWFVECDGDDKSVMLQKLRANLLPSLIIESKRGYHAYWFSLDAKPENYRNLLEFHLIPYFNGDRNAKDIARILRVPDFFHCKDPADKFLIRVVEFNPTQFYSEEVVLRSFPSSKKEERAMEVKRETRVAIAGLNENLFERVYDLDCQDALVRVSGSAAVCGERFDFRRTASGTLNILVNGKSTSCWIDRNKRIGSTDRGGPTIWQWINWYHRDHKKTHEFMKNFFPEVFDV